MTDEENLDVQTGLAEPSSEEVSPDRQEEIQSSAKRNQEYNWSEARRKMQELERKTAEQDELIRRLQYQKQQVEDEDLSSLTDDDIVTVSQAKKLAAKMAKEVAETVVKQRDLSTLEERLNTKWPDFQQIVSKDAIEDLKVNEPELAASLASMSDPYQQAVAAYKLLKKLKGESSLTYEQKKAIENRSKPQAVQTVSKGSPISAAHLFEQGLTPDLKKQLYQEMQQAMKGY